MHDAASIRARIDVLSRVADAWNRAGVDYAVAHGAERYPSSIGRDLDVLVRAGDQRPLDVLTSQLRDSGWRPTVVSRPWVTWVVGHRTEDDGRVVAVEVDLLSKLQWGWCLLVDGPSSERTRERRGPFFLDPWGGFVKRILLQLLAGNFHRFLERPDQLMLSSSEAAIAASRLEQLLGPDLASSAMAAIARKDVPWLRSRVGSIRSSLLKRSLLQRGTRATVVRWARNEYDQWIVPRRVAPVVAFVGPDGVGKSTLIRHVALRLEQDLAFPSAQIRHWRPGLLPQLSHYSGAGRESRGAPGGPPRRTAGKYFLLRTLYYAADYVLGGRFRDNVSSSRLVPVLYDRCLLDMVVDPVRYGLSSAGGVHALRRWLPSPDLVVLLRDDPARIHSRKPELPVPEIRRQLDMWERLHAEGKVHAVLDTSAPSPQLAVRATSMIAGKFAAMHDSPSAPQRARKT